jgi:hypothetical protein
VVAGTGLTIFAEMMRGLAVSSRGESVIEHREVVEAVPDDRETTEE